MYLHEIFKLGCVPPTAVTMTTLLNMLLFHRVFMMPSGVCGICDAIFNYVFPKKIQIFVFHRRSLANLHIPST